ncbi:CysZ protein [Izhakiella capsodis]|uniref:Sulfate transporter CysZ n=1 Tax=Izhakiella capsodis TaxID=1367852 RepID=A0A1I4WH78_9GAMM|nr:sulfate transporter CysZ [Izhakiella capsodis]SFN13154.1 CysZ protein [Izhakiella capsodis]
MINRTTSVNPGGAHYFFQGWKLIHQPGIRRFVLLPLLVNIVLMGSAFLWLFHKLNVWIALIMAHVPDWLQWLSYLLWPLTVISILLVFSYFFSTLTNWIAAPFCGLLSEQLEARLTGQSPPETGWIELMKSTPHILLREWQKLAWYLPRALGLLIFYLIPGLGQTLAPVLWFLFSAWTLAIQYCDYPFDNHKVDFTRMRKALSQYKSDNMQFGALVSLFTLMPIINLVILPVAVCGATAMWVDKYRAQLGISHTRHQ